MLPQRLDCFAVLVLFELEKDLAGIDPIEAEFLHLVRADLAIGADHPVVVGLDVLRVTRIAVALGELLQRQKHKALRVVPLRHVVGDIQQQRIGRSSHHRVGHAHRPRFLDRRQLRFPDVRRKLRHGTPQLIRHQCSEERAAVLIKMRFVDGAIVFQRTDGRIDRGAEALEECDALRVQIEQRHVLLRCHLARRLCVIGEIRSNVSVC